jgi:hypothetical protein
MPKLSKLYTKKQIDAIREELIAKYGDKCALCDKPRSAFKNKLSVDHNHATSKIRGLLCYRCNKFVIGRNDLQSATAILEYLRKYDE